MELLDESKENILPLRRGRNISTLNTALQAQTDAEIHHQLMKEREEFEILVRSYVGEDPLQPWYDYVLWVEQNFPKHGREGNLKTLLENCLLQFKDNEQYSQDVRYIDLWTRYMGFTDDPLGMYRQIHAKGIGAQCAIFYQCWAEEFEKANDMKRADQIYIEGLKRNAQPKDDLVAAHTNFQVRVARSILGQNPIMYQQPEIEERTALSMLRARGRKKNMVDSNRVGNSIRRATPGVLRPHANVALADIGNDNVQASKVVVYNDENAPFTDAVAHPVVKTSVSLQQKIGNKENTLEPGRWNEGKFKKKSSTTAIGMSGVPATPRTPSFRVHADENAAEPKTPKTDIVASNVLKMRRHVYEDEKNIPIAMFEPPDPKKIAMYPKSKVYSGGTEFSLEELRAISYLKREKGKQKESHENKNVDMDFQTQEAELKVTIDERVVNINEDQKSVSEEHHYQQMNVQQKEVCISERSEVKQLCQNDNFEIYMEAEEEMNAKMKHKPQQNFEQKERIPVAAPMQTSFLKDIPASGFLKVPRTILERKESVVPSTDEMFYSGPSFEQKESDQSLTVNTKAVMNEVKGMWVSSPQAKSNPPRVSLAPKSISQARSSISTPLSFTPFKIFSDTSTNEPEQASVVNVHFGKEPEGRKMEKEREIERAEYRKEVSQLCIPQKNTLSRNLFNTRLSKNRYESQDAEMWAMEQNSESALYNERGIFKSSNQEPMSFPRNSSDSTPSPDLKTHSDDLRIFKVPSAITVKEDKEMPKPSMEIPFVPSPGMTPAQLEALKGTEDKENMVQGKCEQMPQPSRSKKSILQPSKEVYFVPLEQQLAEDDTHQGNVLSDETCCTEAFAIPLVSSTPMLHPHLKTKVQEEKPNQEEEEDNTMNLIAFLQKNNIHEKVVPANETNTKTQLVNQASDAPNLPHLTPRISIPKTQLSTILELSDRRRSSMGTTDGSGSSKSSGYDTVSKYNNTRKSSAYHQICEDEIQEEIEMFRNIAHNRRSSPSGSLMFFSGSFRSRCWESSGFPSELHKMNCVELRMPFDINIKQGSSFILGENQYRIFEVISEGPGILSFSAFEVFSKRRVYMELKDNTYLWEQYIREEIKLRVRDKSKIRLFDVTDKTYIFANKFLRVFEKDAKEERCIRDVFEKMTYDISERASEILNLVFHLHQCKIVHGSLSLESFKLISDDLFLNCFEKAVDLTLLPPDTVFDATEEPLYYKLQAYKLSPFQVDYIALANILHQLVFKEPMKVHEEMGKWCISSILPRNDKTLWETLFTALLNNSDVNLLHFGYALEKGIHSRNDRVH